MKGLTKLLAGLVGLAVVLIVAAGILLGFFIDPNDYKPQIEKLARDKAGLELSIGGDIHWTFYPWLGLEINKVQLHYPDQPELAKLEQAKVSVKLLPLLSKEVQMSSLELSGLNLNLVRGEDGGSNWAAPQAPAGAEAQTDTEAPSDTPTAAVAPPIALDIEAINIVDGQIRFDDRQAGSELTLQDLSLTSGQVLAGAWIPLEVGFALQRVSEGADIQSNVHLKAVVQFDPQNRQYRLRGLDSTLQVQTLALGEQPVNIRLSGDVSADLATEQARIDNLYLKLADLSAAGNVSLQNFAAPQFGGELKVAQFNARSWLESLGQPVPETADPKALTRVSLGAALNGPANSLTLKPLTLTVDDSRFTGRLSYDLNNGSIKLDLEGDQLDIDHYLPPEAEKTTNDGQASPAQPQEGGERYSTEPVIPVEPLKTLNLDARLALKQLQASGIPMRDVELAVSAHDGVVNLSRIHANLLGGSVRNSAILDVRATPVRLSAKKNISGLQIGDLLQALNGEEPAITGTLSSQSDVRATGRSVHDIVNSLTGTASFNVTDGTLQGIDMAQTVCQGFNTLGSLGINTEQVDRSTPFANLGGSFQIRNGVVSNQDLAASLDAMAVKGRGSVDLPQALIDYRLGLTIEENLFKQSCSVNNRIQGVEWPVNCKGSFDTPPAQLCRPDLSVFEDLIKQQVKEKVQQKVEEKVEQKLQEKLGEEAKGLLKGLFGN
ncbi:AsmA family protein [Marinobacterium aestuariivivens]|uniref:AsmA family protein n=1 Tax=Marinobacterium aestuariivivens TaxID=1698799 RepID=A0ABW1ZZ03_9GAMM